MGQLRLQTLAVQIRAISKNTTSNWAVQIRAIGKSAVSNLVVQIHYIHAADTATTDDGGDASTGCICVGFGGFVDSVGFLQPPYTNNQ